MLEILIDAKQVAVLTEKIVINYQGLPFTLTANGLSGTEDIKLLKSADGTNFEYMKLFGSTVTLNADNNETGIFGTCMLKLEKGITANPVTVTIMTNSITTVG